MLIKQLLIEGIYKNLLNGEFLCNGDRVSFWDDEKLLEMGGGMGIEAGGGNAVLSLGDWLLHFMEAERRVG